MKEDNIKLLSTTNPYIYLCDSMTTMTYKIVILLLIQFTALLVSKSYDSVLVILFSFLGALAASGLYYLITKENFYKSFDILIQGLFIGFFLPGSFPLPAVFFVTFVILFMFKVYVRNSNNWVNPSILTIIVAYFVGKIYFPGFTISFDLLTTKNPSVALISSGTFPIFSFDSSITNFLNTYVLSIFKVSIPEGLISLLWDTNAAIPAFRFNLLTILSTVVLFCNNYVMGIIPMIFVTVYAVMVRLFAPFCYGGAFNSGDVILALLSSGTLFTAAFMMQYPGTIPISINGKIIYGIIAGLLAFFISGEGTSPIGMAYTILICNVFNLILRYLEDINNEKFRLAGAQEQN